MIVPDLFDCVGNSHAWQRGPVCAGGTENGFNEFMAQARSGSIVHCDVFAFRGHKLERSCNGLSPGWPSVDYLDVHERDTGTIATLKHLAIIRGDRHHDLSDVITVHEWLDGSQPNGASI
jgi:hypothetical protein